MSEEDRKKYAMAQAGQRAAGGAYMMRPPTGQVYEMTDAEMAKNGWNDSVESVDSQQSIHHHSRDNSKNINGAEASPSTNTDGNNMLAVPQPSAIGQNRRSGRSPLARASLIRTASNAGDDLEPGNRRQDSRSRSRSKS